MKTPQVPAMPGMSPLDLLNPLARDQASLAQRKADAPMLAPKPQSACDLGLFSDDARQADMLDMGGVRK
jgi:hypothetical protein